MKRDPASALCAILICAALLCGCAVPAAGRDLSATAAPTPEAAPGPEPTESAQGSSPVPTIEPTPEPTPEPTRSPAPPELPPLPPTDDSYFDDAAFFGNSLVEGFCRYGGLAAGTCVAATSASVLNVSLLVDETGQTLLETLLQKEYGKIYILLGINEIGFETDYFIDVYDGLLDVICAREPNAVIYVLSLTPITEARSAGSNVFSRERIMHWNQALYELAARRGLRFVNLFEALTGPDGYLAAEKSTDGIHLTPEAYREWADYLRTHYLPA